MGVPRQAKSLEEMIDEIYSVAVAGKNKNNVNATKYINLRQEYLSDEKLWVHVGAVFNVFMRPILSGPIIILPQYSCTEHGLAGTHDYSAFRNNLIAVYSTKNYCVQLDGLDFNLKDLTIKATENKIHIMAPNVKKLIVNVDNIRARRRFLYIKSTFYDTYLVQIICADCGEEAKQWISKYLNNPNLRLAYITPQKQSKNTFWHNMNDVHNARWSILEFGIPNNIVPKFKLISYRSFLEINKLLSCPVTIDKYNADICIMPKDVKPYVELEWEWIQIGEIVLRNITPLKRRSIKIDPKDMPLEMKMKLIVLHCELYHSGTMRPGNEVFARLRPTALLNNKVSKYTQLVSKTNMPMV